MKAVTARDLQKKVKECVDTAQEERVVIIRRGRPAAVLVGVEGRQELSVQLLPGNPRSASRLVGRKKSWSHPPESNRRPTDYESVALPTELGWLVLFTLLRQSYAFKQHHSSAPARFLSARWISSDVMGSLKKRTPTASAIALAMAAAVGTLGISPIAFP